MQGIGGLLASILMVILAPIAAMLIQMAISRSREYLADEGGARLSGNPRYLANALKKLQQGVESAPMGAPILPRPTFLSLIPCVVKVSLVFSARTPPLHERVERLEAMAGYERTMG